MTARSRIAVTLCGHDARRCSVAREQYLASVRRAGGEPVALGPEGTRPHFDFDALCLTGGGDIDPHRYQEANSGSTDIDPARDDLESALLIRALELDVPVLGICRGAQLLNVHFGGTLHQHREGHSPKYPPLGLSLADDPAGADAVQHRVTPVADSLLARACGSGEMLVNSSHHQVITADRLASPLRATAWVDDVVEGVESPAHSWVIGVQWHPERVAQVGERATRIFEAFVRAAERVPAR
ncbi:MAG: gamma-glutamyl-gamma-aminobutyrate hydrolase family protein [Chloroflexi bacterium]|nr:gamma-glutamyl-gamma-aminobutyrate hydrolase family protein [Chloroflexota bacterium]